MDLATLTLTLTLWIFVTSVPAAGPEAVAAVASTYQDQGRYGEAEELYLRALAEIAKRGEAAARVELLNSLASLYFETRRYAAAERHAREALSICQSVRGPADPEVARLLANLAAIHHARGRYRKAEPLYRRAVQILSEHPESPELPLALNNLGALRLRRGDAAEAERSVARAIELWTARHGAEHPNVARGLANLAQIRAQAGLPAEAESLLKRAMGMVERAWGPEHPAMAHLRAAYAQVPRHTVRVSDLTRAGLR